MQTNIKYFKPITDMNKEQLEKLKKELTIKYPEMNQEQIYKLARTMLYNRIPKHIRETIENTNSSIGEGINLW